MIKQTYRWAVLQDGEKQAWGTASTANDAIRECLYYAGIYAHDGRVNYWVRRGRTQVLMGFKNHCATTS